VSAGCSGLPRLAGRRRDPGRIPEELKAGARAVFIERSAEIVHVRVILVHDKRIRPGHYDTDWLLSAVGNRAFTIAARVAPEGV
jgi:hypothetical protein